MALDRRINSERDITPALEWLGAMARKGIAGGPLVLSVDRPKRTLPQNSKMWALLQDISLQVKWNGMLLSKKDWKEMFTAALRKQRVVPGIDGNSFVVLGTSTSKMKKAELSDLLEIIYAFGAEHGVEWSEQAAA